LDASHISRDPAVVEAYVNDPLVYRGSTTARLAAEMLSEMLNFPAEAAKITLPITIVQGGDDKLVNVKDSQILYDSISSADKTIKIYEGYYHEVFNDPGFEIVLGDIEAWLEKQLG
jgi:alpha-beta hydrolase superfamily lysophospholipase